MTSAMKSPTLICLCLITVAVVVAAYLLGRDSARLAEVHGDVSELKIQMHGLQADKQRSDGRWSLITRIPAIAGASTT